MGRSQTLLFRALRRLLVYLQLHQVIYSLLWFFLWLFICNIFYYVQLKKFSSELELSEFRSIYGKTAFRFRKNSVEENSPLLNNIVLNYFQTKITFFLSHHSSVRRLLQWFIIDLYAILLPTSAKRSHLVTLFCLLSAKRFSPNLKTSIITNNV